MKALRIKLSQSKAHYRKEETITNKMTYPLPPFSTVIGAIHNACGFRKYHKMELSIQGKYGALSKQAYTDYCFLDSVMDDRGILVKMKNCNIQSSAFEKVASAMKSQGNSFRKDITIQIHNKKLIEEYRALKNLNDEISDFKSKRLNKIKNLFKVRKKSLAQKKKNFDKKSDEFVKISNREKEIINKEKMIDENLKNFEYENYIKEVSKYQSLTTSLKFYEVLHDLELVIHLKSDEETLKIIKDNIYSLKSIGRSEDFVDIKECELVDLKLVEDLDNEIISEYSAYINYQQLKTKSIFFGGDKKEGIIASGTRYKINAIYSNEDGKRKFKKADVVYVSKHKIDDDSKNVWADNKYIVDFVEEKNYV